MDNKIQKDDRNICKKDIALKHMSVSFIFRKIRGLRSISLKTPSTQSVYDIEGTSLFSLLIINFTGKETTYEIICFMYRCICEYL